MRRRQCFSVSVVDPAIDPGWNGGPRFQEGLPQGVGVKSRRSCLSRSTRTAQPKVRTQIFQFTESKIQHKNRLIMQNYMRRRYCLSRCIAPVAAIVNMGSMANRTKDCVVHSDSHRLFSRI